MKMQLTQRQVETLLNREMLATIAPIEGLFNDNGASEIYEEILQLESYTAPELFMLDQLFKVQDYISRIKVHAGVEA